MKWKINISLENVSRADLMVAREGFLKVYDRGLCEVTVTVRSGLCRKTWSLVNLELFQSSNWWETSTEITVAERLTLQGSLITQCLAANSAYFLIVSRDFPDINLAQLCGILKPLKPQHRPLFCHHQDSSQRTPITYATPSFPQVFCFEMTSPEKSTS